jgi:hypothetical protein
MFFFTSAACFLGWTPAFAQQPSPTVQESIVFVNQKLLEQGDIHWMSHKTSAGGTNTNTNTVHVVKQSAALVNGCNLKFNYAVYIGPDGHAPTTDTIDLIQLDPREIKVEEWGVLVKRYSARLQGQVSDDIVDDPAVYVVTTQTKSGNLYFGYFLDQQIATRVAKAVIHAIVLCGGGKDQPF